MIRRVDQLLPAGLSAVGAGISACCFVLAGACLLAPKTCDIASEKP
jgi:hypothetical protein